MTKNYNQIIKGFTKTIRQCEQRINQLICQENETREQASVLLSDADCMASERMKTDRLADNLVKLAGDK